MFSFFELNKLICEYMSDEDRLKVAKAYLFGADAHEAQVRSSGEAYFTHPIAVACILAEAMLDVESVISALLHDVVEDTDYTFDDINERFGEKIALIVEGVTKLTQIRHKNKVEQQAENFRKMIMSVTKDVRVIFVKLADRLHNMRTLAPLKPDKKRRISKETLEVFAPIAHRLGINTLKEQMETLAFEGMYPYRFRVIEERVRQVEKNREKVFNEVKQALSSKLNGIAIPNNINGRKKTLYSIYNKMKNKKMSFSEIMDVYAYKVVVSRKIDCYIALGKIHELYKPLPQKFKDYIATPKVNGYKSLHTIVLGPYNIPIEIQIKTQRMDESAEFGVAAHWSYKSGEESDKALKKWLKKISDVQVYTASSVEFLENVKTDLFNNDVFVFTPNGEIIELPNNSTCVDFAYYVHTAVGNKCLHAKVNRKSVPLSYKLKQGDSVEIITSIAAEPSPLWLDFVNTSRAKSAIKEFIKNQTTNESYIKGKNIVISELHKVDIDLLEIHSDIVDRALYNYDNIETINRFYNDVGLGLISADNFVSFIKDHISDINISDEDSIVRLRYGDDTRICTCCLPIPNDSVKAIVRNDNVEVHRSSCEVLHKALLKENVKEYFVKWISHAGDDASFRARMAITINNRPGGIAKITATLASEGVDIRSFGVINIDKSVAILEAVVIVKNRDEFYSLSRTLRRLDICLDAERILNK